MLDCTSVLKNGSNISKIVFKMLQMFMKKDHQMTLPMTVDELNINISKTN